MARKKIIQNDGVRIYDFEEWADANFPGKPKGPALRKRFDDQVEKEKEKLRKFAAGEPLYTEEA